jgi:Ca2+-binding EF-hand superfamily protein
MRALLMAVAVALCLGSVAQADPPKDSKRPSREEMKKKFMEKFDKNKDGKIDDREKEAIRAEFAKRRGHHEGDGHHKGHGHEKAEAKKRPAKVEKKDGEAKKPCCPAAAKKGKDGEAKKPCCPAAAKKPSGSGDAKRPGHSDWAKRREEMKKKFMEQHDKNKDGKIDDKEKEAAREAFRQRASEWMKERTEKGAAHIIVELDKNKDGKLNADEVPEKYREHFGETDKNEDGNIDEAELTKALEAAREKLHDHVKQRIEEHRKRHSK